MRPSGHALGPSERAFEDRVGFHEETPMPEATAARASTGMNSRWPPEAVPCPPGSCTEWVASKTTGHFVSRMIERERIRRQGCCSRTRIRARNHDGVVAGRASLVDDVLHLPRERNCPFLMLTGLPCEAVFTMKFVCRHRKAGVCRTSTTEATSARACLRARQLGRARLLRDGHLREPSGPRRCPARGSSSGRSGSLCRRRP